LICLLMFYFFTSDSFSINQINSAFLVHLIPANYPANNNLAH
jgi:hypothetical protein